MPRLKICGITNAAFAREAALRNVDYLGFIFAAASPRRIAPEAARAIASAVKGPQFVGVFTDAHVDEILAIAAQVPIGVIQLHGKYGAADVAALKSRGFEVWRLYDGSFSGEDASLLDGRVGGRCGGTGRLADWSLVAKLKSAGRRIVLAGGISSANIAAAVATGADIIDVNSSLETSPGVKSIERLDELFISHEVHKVHEVCHIPIVS